VDWKNISTDLLITNYQKNNYILKDGIYQANIFGIRANNPANNTFDDIVGILRKNFGKEWEVLLCGATTDPGLYWLEHPMNVKGAAILMPGQYVGSHKIGLHKGKYRALIQCGKLHIWRDNDKDKEYDHESPQDSENDGINIHHAGIASTEIDQWSAGCQVIASITEWNEFITQIDEHLSCAWNELFDYTLFEEKSL
jgi:hypothetical protein